MRYRYCLLLLFLLSIHSLVLAQSVVISRSEDKKSYKEVRGLMPSDMPSNSVNSVVENGDTIPMGYLSTIYILPREKFKSERDERYYWKMVRDVKKVYPLSKIVYYTLLETMDYIETLPDQKSKEKHLKRMEKDLVEEYEPMLRKMSYNQGKILIKLIDRECELSSYDLIKAYRGSFAAGFWQGVAKIFRTDLKSEYDPKNKDYTIERIIIRIDQGQL